MKIFIGYIEFEGGEGVLKSCMANDTDQAWDIFEEFSETDNECKSNKGFLTLVQQLDSVNNINTKGEK
jgi:hypothetical protein